MTKLILVENHIVFIELLFAYFIACKLIEVVDVCSDGNQLMLSLEENNNVDVILMDHRQIDGVMKTIQIKKEYPSIRIIGYSDEDIEVSTMIQHGASAFLSKKEATLDELIKEIVK